MDRYELDFWLAIAAIFVILIGGIWGLKLVLLGLEKIWDSSAPSDSGSGWMTPKAVGAVVLCAALTVFAGYKLLSIAIAAS
ncbi:MAG: hypothetical protein JWR84_1251 [Caulobacter sp.]|nr:hypothetical protein [Caulobacter sp.]